MNGKRSYSYLFGFLLLVLGTSMMPGMSANVANDNEEATTMADATETETQSAVTESPSTSRLYSISNRMMPTSTLISTAPTGDLPGIADVVLRSGSRENLKNNVLHSADGVVFLSLNFAGDLVLKKQSDYEILWKRRVPDYSDAREVSMETNGNFAVYGPTGQIYWQTETSGNIGADLRLQGDGFLCVYSNGRCIWSNGFHADPGCIMNANTSTTTSFPQLATQSPPADPNGIILRSGETKDLATDFMESPNKIYRLRTNYLQDLVVVRNSDGAVIWTQVIPGLTKITMHANGNLVVYGVTSIKNGVIWQTGTTANPGAELRLEDEGHLCLYNNGRCVWSNGIRVEHAPVIPRLPNLSDVVMYSGLLALGKFLVFLLQVVP